MLLGNAEDLPRANLNRIQLTTTPENRSNSQITVVTEYFSNVN